MYPGEHARLRPDQPAVIMAGSGETLTYHELERRSNAECCAAGERAGLYYTCINSYLAPDEVAYIVNTATEMAASFAISTRRRPESQTRRSPTRLSGPQCFNSSGTTGRPKGILRPLPDQPPAEHLPIFDFFKKT